MKSNLVHSYQTKDQQSVSQTSKIQEAPSDNLCNDLAPVVCILGSLDQLTICKQLKHTLD